MRGHLTASFIVACTGMIAASQNGFAQSPPADDPDVLIWSDRDLSLRPGGFALTETETETNIPRPQRQFSGNFGGSRGILICEPGQPDVVEAAIAAYAQASKQPGQQPR